MTLFAALRQFRYRPCLNGPARLDCGTRAKLSTVHMQPGFPKQVMAEKRIVEELGLKME
jgi:hypothetical protein